MAQAVAERAESVPSNVDRHPASDGAAMIQMIERVALNPNIDIAKMERLLEMQERIMTRNAAVAFAAALSAMQAELPVIPERGKIKIKAKNSDGERDGKVLQETPYALWEDINDAIKPVLHRHGFALSFRTGMAPDGRVSVTAVLSHEQGHREETTMVLMHDSSGSKNAVQAIGSSTSYGKRYAAMALLNLTSRGEDDDGQAAGAVLSKGAAREPWEALRDEVDACSTVVDLGRLWRSKPFQAEYERLPNDWKVLLNDHINERKADLEAPAGKVEARDTLDRQFPGDR